MGSLGARCVIRICDGEASLVATVAVTVVAMVISQSFCFFLDKNLVPIASIFRLGIAVHQFNASVLLHELLLKFGLAGQAHRERRCAHLQRAAT
jgi:hypothetical protein